MKIKRYNIAVGEGRGGRKKKEGEGNVFRLRKEEKKGGTV